MKTKIELANDDFTAMAAIILEGLGGKENVTVLTTASQDFVWRSKITLQ